VCLNDLIEKVILPGEPEYGTRTTRTVHLPLSNVISAEDPQSALSVATYAKRPKLYAAFEKFAYQQHELEFALQREMPAPNAPLTHEGTRDLLALVRHFLAVDLRYDFWTRMPEWKPIEWSYREISRLNEFLATGAFDDEALREYLTSPGSGLEALSPGYVESLDPVGLQRTLSVRIQFIWHRLSNLSRMYEELVREWFLPTYLAQLLTEHRG